MYSRARVTVAALVMLMALSPSIARAQAQVDQNYRVGPGDKLVVTLSGDVKLVYHLDITSEGAVVIPKVGLIRVDNLTIVEVREALFARLSSTYPGLTEGPDARIKFALVLSNARGAR